MPMCKVLRASCDVAGWLHCWSQLLRSRS